MKNNSLYLADTSAWLRGLPSRAPPSQLRERMDQLLAEGLVLTTGIVRLELLGALTHEADYGRRAELLDALPSLPTTERRWDEAAELGSHLRRLGLTIPSTDLVIAAVAMAAGAIVLHRDRRFDLIAQHAPLVVESHLGNE